MRVRRRPPEYEAIQEGTNWVVINLATKERKLFTSKEFRLQFEPILDEKKPVAAASKTKPALVDNSDKPRLLHWVDPNTGALEIRETFGPWELK